jgi:hypothetical protein
MFQKKIFSINRKSPLFSLERQMIDK